MRIIVSYFQVHENIGWNQSLRTWTKVQKILQEIKMIFVAGEVYLKYFPKYTSLKQYNVILQYMRRKQSAICVCHNNACCWPSYHRNNREQLVKYSSSICQQHVLLFVMEAPYKHPQKPMTARPQIWHQNPPSKAKSWPSLCCFIQVSPTESKEAPSASTIASVWKETTTINNFLQHLSWLYVPTKGWNDMWKNIKIFYCQYWSIWFTLVLDWLSCERHLWHLGNKKHKSRCNSQLYPTMNITFNFLKL